MRQGSFGRLLLAAAVVGCVAWVSPAASAQTVFYPAATALDGTQAGVVYDVPSGGFAAATRDPLGVVGVLPGVPGLSVQSVYQISPNGRYVSGTAAGWGWAGNVYSYLTVPVVWDVDTGDVRVIPVPAYTVYATPTKVADDGSGTARTYSFRFGSGGIAWGPAE